MSSYRFLPEKGLLKIPLTLRLNFLMNVFNIFLENVAIGRLRKKARTDFETTPEFASVEIFWYV